MNKREQDFSNIIKSLSDSKRIEIENAVVFGGDSLSIIRKIPDHSISLILTDPPYHATKKQNIYGDTHFSEDNHYIEWMSKYAIEWKRILKSNGSLFCFCDSSMAAKLEVMLSKEFNILSHVVWTKPNEPGFDGWKGKMKKESLRQWYPHSERIIFAEPAAEGNLNRSSFANFLRTARIKAGLSQHELTGMTGAYGKVNHGGAVSNWEAGRNTPSREQYEKICEAIINTGHINSMPVYEDVIRVFSIDKSKEFTDVWNFPSVKPYKGKHPAEKPINLLIHAIEATTYENDIVLDCFAGSGNTAMACLGLNRKSISIEIDEKWIGSMVSKFKEYSHSNNQAPIFVEKQNINIHDNSIQIGVIIG